MKEEIAELLNRTLLEHKDDPKALKKFYKKYYAEQRICWTCPGVVESKYKSLGSITDEKILQKGSILKLKDDVLIDTHMSSNGPHGHYTKHNITDAIAIQLIQNGWGSRFVNPEDIDLAYEILGDEGLALKKKAESIAARNNESKKPIPVHPIFNTEVKE